MTRFYQNPLIYSIENESMAWHNTFPYWHLKSHIVTSHYHKFSLPDKVVRRIWNHILHSAIFRLSRHSIAKQPWPTRWQTWWQTRWLLFALWSSYQRLFLAIAAWPALPFLMNWWLMPASLPAPNPRYHPSTFFLTAWWYSFIHIEGMKNHHTVPPTPNTKAGKTTLFKSLNGLLVNAAEWSIWFDGWITTTIILRAIQIIKTGKSGMYSNPQRNGRSGPGP